MGTKETEGGKVNKRAVEKIQDTVVLLKNYTN